jgi:transposase
MRESRQHRYPTDLSDAEWVTLEPLLPPPAMRGRPPKWPRHLLDEADRLEAAALAIEREPPWSAPEGS